jgi:hypothetical protein
VLEKYDAGGSNDPSFILLHALGAFTTYWQETNVHTAKGEV